MNTCQFETRGSKEKYTSFFVANIGTVCILMRFLPTTMPTLLTLEKGIDALEVIVRQEHGIGTRALARAIKVNATTAHNITLTFLRLGYVRQDPVTRRFFPGIHLLHLGRHASYHRFLIAPVRGELSAFVREVNETVQLVVYEQERFINLLFLSSTQKLAVQESDEIDPATVHCTAYGKLLLGYAGEASLETHLTLHGLPAMSPHSITDPDRFREEMRRVRKQGFSETCDEAWEGISAVAVPILDPWGGVFASIGSSAPTVRMKKPGFKKSLLAALKQRASAIEAIWSPEMQDGEARA